MTQMNLELIHWGYSDMITGRQLWWTCPLYVQSLLSRRRTDGRRSWISDIMVGLRHLLVQASSCTPQAFSSFPVQIFILSPLWPTLAKCHTFHSCSFHWSLSEFMCKYKLLIKTWGWKHTYCAGLIPNSATRQRLKTKSNNIFNYLKCACGRAAASLLMMPVQTEEGQTKRCARVKRRTKWRRGCNQC